MPGPQNAIIGDDSFGTELPETQIDDKALTEEKKAARYSKSAEYKKLKQHFESRIEFYQTYLPGGKPVAAASKMEREEAWAIANLLIAEFNTVINFYETAKEVVKEADRVV